MQECLYLITSHYPSDFGDAAFLEKEMQYLSKHFKKIIVISSFPEKDKKVAMPSNCHAYFLPNIKGGLHKALYWPIAALKNMPFLLHEVANLIKAHAGIRKYISCIRCYQKAISVYYALGRIIKAEGAPSLIYTFWYKHEALACAMLSKKYKFCSRAHGHDLYEYASKTNYQPFKRIIDKRISAVFFISKQGMEYYKKHFATGDDSKYRLSYLGTENYYTENVQSPKCEFELLTLSNIVPVKKMETAVTALSLLPPDIKLHWTHIGDGSDFDIIHSLAKNLLDDKDNIDYRFCGRLSHCEVLEYLNSNHVSCLMNTSKSEGLPVSMMEAFSFGIPVIAPDVGGISEIVDNGKNGYLLPKDAEAKAYADAITKMYSLSAPLYAQMRENARRKWQSDFSADTNYSAFATALEELC